MALWHARREIVDIQQETPSLTRPVLGAMWNDGLVAARDAAAGEMHRLVPPLALTWDEVFVTEHRREEM